MIYFICACELLTNTDTFTFLVSIGSYTVCYISLIFDAIGVGHCAWTVYFLTRRLCCSKFMDQANLDKLQAHPGTDVENSVKPMILRVQSAEIEDAMQRIGKKEQQKSVKSQKDAPTLQLPRTANV